MLDYIVEGLRDNGVEEILLVVGYREEVVRAHYGDGTDHGVAISYVTQETQDGTGKVVELARDFAGEDSFILSYGDILVPASSYSGLVDIGGDDAALTIKRAPEEEVSKGGAVFIEAGYVTDLVEKPQPPQPTSCYYNAGIYAFSPHLFDYTARLELSPRGEYELTDAIRAMAQDGLRIRAVELIDDWVDVRDPEVLEQLNSQP